MNNTSFTIEQLQALSWQNILALKKETILLIMSELSLDYCEDGNYFKLCSTLYQHLKQLRLEQLTQVEPTPQVEVSDDDVLVDVDFHNMGASRASRMSFRELQLKSIGKLHRKEVQYEPIPKPTPAVCRVIRTHDNNGSYYGMPVIRCLVRDIKTNKQWWTGSNKLANIQPGDLVQESVDIQGYPVDWVVPYKQPIIATV